MTHSASLNGIAEETSCPIERRPHRLDHNLLPPMRPAGRRDPVTSSNVLCFRLRGKQARF